MVAQVLDHWSMALVMIPKFRKIAKRVQSVKESQLLCSLVFWDLARPHF